MVKPLPAILSVLALVACASPAPAGPVTLTEIWRMDGFAQPESVAPSADGTLLYVSNVAGEPAAKDFVGFISRMTPDGMVVEREWVNGLHAPKGMAVAGGKLYVSDIDALVSIDAVTGAIASRIPIDGARFLSDVAIARDGSVLVSDSGGAKIYAVSNGVVSVWLDDPLLAAVNGLTPDGDRLLVATMRGRVLAVDWQLRRITVLSEGVGDGDGIASVGGGHLVASEWRGRIFHITPDGAPGTILDTRQSQVLQNDLALVGDRLYVANMLPGTVTAWKVER